MAGRESSFDIVLDGVPYRVAEANGTPQWSADPVPLSAQDSFQLSEEERRHTSWHSGFGYEYWLAPDTYHWANNFDCRFPRQGIMGPLQTTFAASATITGGFVELGSALYVLAGRYCQKIDTTNDVCETPDAGANGKDFGAGVVAIAGREFDTALYVGFSSTTFLWQLSGVTWTQSADAYGGYLAEHWSDLADSFVLDRSQTVSSNPTVSWVAEGSAPLTEANWAADYVIGEDSQAIKGLAGGGTNLFVAKRDGLHYVDRTGRSIRAFEALPHDDNNGVGLFMDSVGAVWYPASSGLYRFNPASGEILEASPGRGLPNGSPIYGRFTARADYKGWSYVAVYNGEDTYIMAGRPREGGEPGFGGYVWHGSLYKVTGAAITSMHVTGLTSPPRLYYAYGSTVGYVRLPAKGDNPVVDSDYRYAASGSVYFPADNIGVPGTIWNLQGFVVENEGCSAATYVDVYAQLDDGGWQKVESVKASGRAYVPVPASGDWRFTNCAFRLDITNAASGSTPVIRAITLRTARRPPVRDLIQTTLICSELVTDRYGVPSRLRGDTPSGTTLLSHLKTLSGAGPVTLKDYFTGQERSRRVLVMPVRERIVRGRQGEEAMVGATVTMACLSSETVSTEQAASAGIYDSAVYGTDIYG